MQTMQWHAHFHAIHNTIELNLLYTAVTNESPSETR